MCFVVFGCIWDRFVTAWNLVQNGLNWCNYCKSSCHDVVSDSFAKKAPDPPHWTLNPCFYLFHSVWVHLGSFHYCMKLGAKRAELVQLLQKFVPQSRVGIVHNAWTQSTPLNPKLMFRCVSQCLGPFGIVSFLHEIWCKTGWTGAINAKVRATMSSRNISQQMHKIHSIGP